MNKKQRRKAKSDFEKYFLSQGIMQLLENPWKMLEDTDVSNL